jgi:tRNA dimethylallyltransferase
MSGVLIVTGPTASGKTGLAIALAERFDAEIVGADSRQVYRDMPIGTATPTPEQQARVAHHLIGFLDPHERYSAARFVRDAAAAIQAIHARGKRAIVCGGTGFYLRALVGDVELSPVYGNELRERLAREQRLHGAEFLAEWLQALDPQRAAAIDAKDQYRLTRALEIALAARAEIPGEEMVPLPTLRATGIPCRKVYLDISTPQLDERIITRTGAMLAAGFVEEAERVGVTAVAANAVGYRDAFAYLDGTTTYEGLRTLLARNTRQYAKRQRTWFRAEPDLVRIDSAEADAWSDVAREIPGWA